MIRHSLAVISAAAVLQFASPHQGRAQCPEGPISVILVDRNEVFPPPTSPTAKRFSWIYTTANRLHKRTREDVIRRELLFKEGDCYDGAILEDSERLLRNTPFIADADISAVRLPNGTVRVTVTTRDEWTTRPEIRLNTGGGLSLKAIELSEANLGGTGQEVAIYSREADGERIYGASYATPQLMGSRWDFALAAGKTSAGYFVNEVLAYPFLGETGLWSARQQFIYDDRYFEFFVPRLEADGLSRILFAQRRGSFDVSGVRRFGTRRNFTLVGGALVGEWIEYTRAARFATPEDSAMAPPLVLDRFPHQDTVKSIRPTLLLGQRSISFLRRRGIDAVNAAEDIPFGTEIEVAVGRGLGLFDTDEDFALNVGFLTGAEYRGVLGGLRVVTEAKRNIGSTGTEFRWSDILGQLDAWAYWHPLPTTKHTLVATVSAAGGWRTTIPFQATVGGHAGLRGFPDHIVPGEQRVVTSLEARSHVPWARLRQIDVGTVAFVDAGRIWQGGDPFGVDSPFYTAVGGGLRVAFPKGSRRTYRLDVAFPVAGDAPGKGVVVTAGVGQAIGLGALRDESQIRRSARRPLAASLLSLPR